MKPISIFPALGTIALLLVSPLAFSQEISRELRSFDKIVASPRINLILEKGGSPAIRVTYAGIDAEKINIEVRNRTLRVYLDDAKVNEPTTRGEFGSQGIYRHASVTAYVTYTALEHLEIRGNQELTCNGPLNARKFTLRAYGENIIDISSVSSAYFKTSLYGENQLKVRDGRTEFQKYRLFGENKIDTRGMKSFAATTNTYGESRIRLNTQEELKINAFGESDISNHGDAIISRGLIFGNTRISRSE